MKKFKKALQKLSCLSVAALLILSFVSAAGTTAQKTETAVVSLDTGKWNSDTYAAVTKVIAENKDSETAYAVFDWDNTCIFQDTTDNLMNYQINFLKFKMTPEQFE